MPKLRVYTSTSTYLYVMIALVLVHLVAHVLVQIAAAADEFPPLTDEEEDIVSRALVPRPPQQVLTEGFKLQLTRADIATLGGLNWLNDEVLQLPRLF